MASRMASMVRASSPPEATLASGCERLAGVGPEQEAHLVGRPVPVDGDREPGRGHGQFLQCRLDLRRPVRGAASRRAAATSASASPSTARAAAISSSSAAARCSWTRWRRRRSRASAAKASTSARSVPYLRSSSWNSWRRGRIPSRRSGSSSQVSTTVRSSVAEVGEVGHGRPHPRLEGGQRWAAGQGPGGLGQSVQRAPVVRPDSAARASAAACRCEDAADSRSSSTSSRAVLVGVLDGRGLDLVELIGEQVDLAGPLPGVAAEVGGLVDQPLQLEARRLEVGAGRCRRRRRGRRVGRRRGRGIGAGAGRAVR